MEAAESFSTSSKVIVQCTDQYGLLEKISASLEARLPLGNLHWKSPTRPLRSIDKLNVSFVREANSSNLNTPTRRHQIPGLRQTPYVRLLLLRCDDRENYKDTARKEVKEWLKRQGISQDAKTANKGQERHDAFEHLIVHVVLPGTPTAAQPKATRSITTEASDSTDSLNNRTKWAGKNASSVYDKLRADFSSSSKGQIERVAQIRVPDPATKSTSATSSEIEELWQDFIEKLKAAILQSFDTRVSQYEDDIRDRENQRLLPGWNFCTFFVLKEGLARGFENMGLIEDSLTVYEELDAGLDKVVQEQISSGDVDSAGALLPFSQDLKPAIRAALDTLGHEQEQLHDLPQRLDLDTLIEIEKHSFPLDTNKIDYQHRILTNQVSALDLRLYMYTRKLRLLFRRAKNQSAANKSRMGGSPYDVGRVSEICAQAIEFINFASRALRRDLYAAWGGQEGLSTEELQTQKLIIGNLVASWKISAILQVLDECQVSQILADTLTDEVRSPTNTQGAIEGFLPTNRDPLGGPLMGNRGGSLSPLDQRQSSAVSLLPSPQPQREAPHSDSRERLALWTAELLVALRDIIEVVYPGTRSAQLHTLKDERVNESNGGTTLSHSSSGIRSASLKAAQASPRSCKALYKMLTAYAYRCYEFANQIQASRQMVLSLAQMALADESSQQAIMWIEQIPDLLSIEAKTMTDLTLFNFYSQCLDKHEEPNKFARCLLSIMQFSTRSMGDLALSRASIVLQDVLDELVEVSGKTENYDLPFGSLYQVSSIKSAIGHFPDRDGFFVSVTLNLRHQLRLRLDNARLTLVSAQNNDPQTISLETEGSFVLDSSRSLVKFGSNVTTTGLYDPDHLHIQIGNLHFIHLFRAAGEPSDRVGHQAAPLHYPRLQLYPRLGAFSIQARLSQTTDLTRSARIAIQVETHDNDVQECLIHLKPGTGGFRLGLQSTTSVGDVGAESFEMIPEERSHVIRLAGMTKDKIAVLEFPYTVENGLLSTVQLRIEARYSSGKDTLYSYFDQAVAIGLPITVNVQDIFQPESIFLRFTASPAGKGPIKVLHWSSEDAGDLQLRSSSVSRNATSAFSRLPTSWVIQVQRDRGTLQKQPRLTLTVTYQCFDEIALEATRGEFLRSLQQSPLARFSPLLEWHLVKELPKLWTEHALEMFALLHELENASFALMQWDQVLQAMSAEDRAEAEIWLESWHTTCTRISLSQVEIAPRVLKLFVDIPQPSLLISTQLCVDESCRAPYYEMGKPIAAHLVILCDRTNNDDYEIQYDVTAAHDVWLLAGKKHGRLINTETQRQIPVLLIPQKTGHLLLPTVEIRCRQVNSEDAPEHVTAEVEHKSQAESLLVIKGLQAVTLAIGDEFTAAAYNIAQKGFR